MIVFQFQEKKDREVFQKWNLLLQKFLGDSLDKNNFSKIIQNWCENLSLFLGNLFNRVVKTELYLSKTVLVIFLFFSWIVKNISEFLQSVLGFRANSCHWFCQNWILPIHRIVLFDNSY